MVAVFNQDLPSWYLINNKLREYLEPHQQQLHSNENLAESPEIDPGQDEQLLQKPEEETEICELPGESRDELAISIEDKIDRAHRGQVGILKDRVCIYRVPQQLREKDDKAYAPQIVSLGPYHYGKSQLQQMDLNKWRTVRQILKRNNQDVATFLKAMKELEEKARACYEGPIDMSSDEFVEMLLRDGCFVLEIFRATLEGGFGALGYSRDDPVSRLQESMRLIQQDMIMLENQLPLFVLDHLLQLQVGIPNNTGLVAELATWFFHPLTPTDYIFPRMDQWEPETESLQDKGFDPLSPQVHSLHCLDAFRQSLLQSDSTPVKLLPEILRKKQTFSVTQLREAGITFRKSKTNRLWDIKFMNGHLEIPKLVVNEDTKYLFLNLMAFEQRHPDSTKEITSYVIFINNLMKSPEDVGFLDERGIVEHSLGSDAELANTFRQMCQGVTSDVRYTHFDELMLGITEYYDKIPPRKKHLNKKWYAWMKILKAKYCSSPWAIISLSAAFILLILTSLQTFYAVYAYHKPPK